MRDESPDIEIGSAGKPTKEEGKIKIDYDELSQNIMGGPENHHRHFNAMQQTH